MVGKVFFTEWGGGALIIRRRGKERVEFMKSPALISERRRKRTQVDLFLPNQPRGEFQSLWEKREIPPSPSIKRTYKKKKGLIGKRLNLTLGRLNIWWGEKGILSFPNAMKKRNLQHGGIGATDGGEKEPHLPRLKEGERRPSLVKHGPGRCVDEKAIPQLSRKGKGGPSHR